VLSHRKRFSECTIPEGDGLREDLKLAFAHDLTSGRFHITPIDEMVVELLLNGFVRWSIAISLKTTLSAAAALGYFNTVSGWLAGWLSAYLSSCCQVSKVSESKRTWYRKVIRKERELIDSYRVEFSGVMVFSQLASNANARSFIPRRLPN
jgi:hypothetical protein